MTNNQIPIIKHMNLIIVESPTKAKTLSRFLGGDYVVEATKGHIKDLPKSKLGVDIENNFLPLYEIIPKKEETIKNLKAKAKNAALIYLATDPDREGEAIAYHVCELITNHQSAITSHQSPVIKRIVFHEITKEAVEDAITHPRDIDEHLVDAQIARRVLDRLVGYKLSPLLWRKVRRGLSAGRVQSVAVRLIVEREREIASFKPEEYWEIFANLKSQISNFKFRAQLVKPKAKDKTQADQILAELKESQYQVSAVKTREVVKSPYPPFTTSTMTQAAARLFGWSAKKTMSIAQSLYEEGFITYHRTDSLNLAEIAVEKAREFIMKEYGKEYLPEKPRFYKTASKVAQEAHEAIRPTTVGQIPNSKFQMPNDAKKLYELIWRRFLACQMIPAVYREVTINIAAGRYLLRASGQTMVFEGWRKIMPPTDSSLEPTTNLPDVKKDEVLDLDRVWSEQKFTAPPARFNEASLIKTLEKLGIGRPSTYAPIISTIQVRQYVEKNESKQFVPTPVGVAVNDFLVTHFPEIFDYQFTAEMENNLDKIAEGKLPWAETIKDFYLPFENKLQEVTKNSARVKIETEKLGKKCPLCRRGELVIRTGRFGKFVSCSRFPDCKYTEKYIEKAGMVCPECQKGEVIIKKTAKGRKFFGCSRYPECKWASWRSPKRDEVKNEI